MQQKKSFAEPRVRVLSETTELPDSFPGAAYFRRRGLATYHAVFNMSAAEFALAEAAVGSDVVRRISELRRK